MHIKATNYSIANHKFSEEELNLSFIYPALLEFKKLKTPVSVAYNIVKSIREVERALKECNDTRVAICESLCEKDEAQKPIFLGNQYKFTDENLKEFNKKWTELLNTEVVLDIWPIKQSDINSLKEINISCYETLFKYGFINDDTKVEVKEVSPNGKASNQELAEVK